MKPVESGVYKWKDLSVKRNGDREGRVLFEGQSPHFDYFKIHSTTQYPGAKPSTAHANEDKEECIIVKEGTLEVTIDGETRILGPGRVVLWLPYA